MQTVQGPVLQSLRAVQSFLDEHADKLGDVVKTGARRRLDEAIADLTNHLSDQSGGLLESKGATRRHRVLRRSLIRDYMAPIARIAKADLPPTPAIEPLHMPKGRPTAERLAQIAYGMAQAAEPYAASFVSAGLPEDFLKQLTGAADAMLGTLTERTSSKGRRGGATRGLRAKLSAGRKIVHILDAFVSTALTNDPALLRAWNLVKRVPKQTGRAATAVVDTTGTPLPGTAPSLAPTTLAPAGITPPSAEGSSLQP
jgi:hypothetical protein